jgi:hypothetical protein
MRPNFRPLCERAVDRGPRPEEHRPLPSRNRNALLGLGALALVAVAAVVIWSGRSSPAKTAATATATCTTTVKAVAAAVDAVGAAEPGDVVCLADGAYGPVALDATKALPGVTLRAEHPGAATIAGAKLSGSHLTLAQFRMTGTFDVAPGSTGMTAAHNFFDLNAYTGYGVLACGSTTTTCNDVSIVGNRFAGRSEEDAIRANRYHDGPDADRYGLLIEGNEFTGNQETGDHNDVFQSVWVGDGLYFRRNYIHDFGGQGLFVKDQGSAIVGLVAEDNLIVDQDLRCAPVSLCPTWQLAPLQLFGPIQSGAIRHNTVWPGRRGGLSVLRDPGWSDVVVADNVFGTFGRDAAVAVSARDNSRCGNDGAWAGLAGMREDCHPGFIDPAHGDYRRRDGRGVTWRVADQRFGPGTAPGPS